MMAAVGHAVKPSPTDRREPPYAIEHIVAEELGNSSYVVADLASGEAAVIDPVRDVEQYVQVARRRGWRLLHALDTHVHNDFLSGGHELAALGSVTYARPFGADGERLRTILPGEHVALGQLRLEALATPGHTPEHMSYRLRTDGGDDAVLFSGGALMVGTIARPDLLGADRTFALGRAAFATVQDVLLPMADSTQVLPTHGGGSFCGASSSGDRDTTIGRERRDNPLLQGAAFLEFLAVYADQGEFPAYYAHMAPRNRGGVPLLGVPLEPLSRLDPGAAGAMVEQGSWLVDVRDHQLFDAGFIPGSLNLGLEGPTSAWLGWVMHIDDPVVLVAGDAAAADLARRRLVRIGIDRVAGWLHFDTWAASGRPTQRMRRGAMADLAQCIEAGERLAVIDTRQEREWVAGHLPGAVHALPPDAAALARSLPTGGVIALHCSTGYRSSLAASLLAREVDAVPWHIVDGVGEWLALGLPLTKPGS